MGRRQRYDSSSEEDDKRDRRRRRHASLEEDREKSRYKGRDSESEELEKEVRRERDGTRNERKLNSEIGDLGDRDPTRLRKSNKEEGEIEESEHRKSRKDDTGSHRSLGHDEHMDDKDYRKVEHHRHRYDSGDGEDDKGRHREADIIQILDAQRDRSRRSGGQREDNEERGQKRIQGDNYSSHDRKEQRRDREKGNKGSSANGDKDVRRKEKDGTGTKAGGKENDIPNVRNPEGNVASNITLGKTGGVYIPPFKLARMMKDIEDKSSNEYQKMTWDALRKSINGLVNKVNATNIKNIIPELFAENLIRGRGLFCRSCMKSQMASPGFTDVFAALVAVVNTKFPEIGDLLIKRIILQLQRAYKRNMKPQLLAAVKFIAHLVNQQVVHELIALELLTVLLEKPTDDSVEVAVGFVTECGSMLQDLSPRGLDGIFERFRGILHEGEIDKRVQYLIETLFGLRRAKFLGHSAVRPELDLVEQEDQLTHEVSLMDEVDPEEALDIFKPDPQFVENEKRYEDLKTQILGEESDEDADSDGDGDAEGASDEDEDDESEEEEEQMKIKDETETNLINLRRTIYLTIMSSATYEEAGHKLLSIKLEPGQEMQLCIMLLECCSQERTYLRFYGLIAGTLCMKAKVYQENFDKCFVQQYSMIHRLETKTLRNVAMFFGHLLGTDKLPWNVLAYIRLTEEDTTSSSRIFIKLLFQEISEHLGIRQLNERLCDPSMQDSVDSIFPKDNPKNTRFAINFFTSIGLGGITENLREYLKNMPRLIMQQQTAISESEKSDSDSDSDSSRSSSSDSSASDSETDSDDRRQKKRKGK